MKHTCLFLFASLILTGCFSPQYYLDKGDYNSAIKAYGLELRDQPVNRKKRSDLEGLELAFNTAQHKDSAELSQLNARQQPENWPRTNQLYRDIQERQAKVKKWQPLRSRKGYEPKLRYFPDVDSLESASRLEAAKYMYQRAQDLLAQRAPAPAREAYHLLTDLKKNYYPYWENANNLLDSAWTMGKEHVLFITESQVGASDSKTFWENMRKRPPVSKNDWLVIHQDSSARKSFDYVLSCQLRALDVGSDNQHTSTRTETKEVEDGYEEVRDTSGRVISRTTKYRTETTTITTYSNSRSANASVFMELKRVSTGELLVSAPISSSYNFSESSETSMPQSPTYWGMIDHVADDTEWEIRRRLKRALPLK
ncbi:MAG TPA: hypothetical protein VK168_04600 [Saprospiraceae bacterium]|nr:hypothetical protein [Saprospiraceae bacterium]